MSIHRYFMSKTYRKSSDGELANTRNFNTEFVRLLLLDSSARYRNFYFNLTIIWVIYTDLFVQILNLQLSCQIMALY